MSGVMFKNVLSCIEAGIYPASIFDYCLSNRIIREQVGYCKRFILRFRAAGKSSSATGKDFGKIFVSFMDLICYFIHP